MKTPRIMHQSVLPILPSDGGVVGNCPIHLHAIARWEETRSCVKSIMLGCLWVTAAKLACPITYLNNEKSWKIMVAFIFW